MIADRLHARGLSYGIAKHITEAGYVFCVDVVTPDGRRFVVKSDELLTAFLELQSQALGGSSKAVPRLD